ncbi:27468_t:CDS:1, partial [Dentiscutata erythropus]
NSEDIEITFAKNESTKATTIESAKTTPTNRKRKVENSHS